MRLDHASLTAASGALLSAAALGRSWEDGLDDLARAAGCHSACIWASRDNQAACVGNAAFFTEGVAKINRPGDVPYTDAILISSRTDDGFVSLDTHPQGARIRRVPFYNEVLRRLDFSRFGGYSLDPGDGSLLKVGLWRGLRDGAFEGDQIEALNLVARDIRAAVSFARAGGELVVRERSSAYARGSEAAYRLDGTGKATPVATGGGDASDLPLVTRRGRLVAAFDDEARHVDRIVGEAVRRDGRPGSTVLTSPQGQRYQFIVLPLRGDALDVFSSDRAMAKLVRIGGGGPRLVADAAILLSDAFDLTDRETEVAMLVSQGLPPAAVARGLRIGEGTVRNHLKAVLRKVGVHGQVELAALVARY